MNDSFVEVRHVSFGFTQELILEDICLSIHAGDYLALIGPNGGGKTTLIKLILGLLNPWKGEIIYGSELKGRKGVIGYVPQSSTFDNKFPLTAFQVVLMGLAGRKTLWSHFNKDEKEKALECLEKVKMADSRNRPIQDLSGGQVQRVLIARAIMGNPQLLLLDEPTSSIDFESRELLASLLDQLNQSMPLVVITHDLTAISHQIKQIACVNRKLHYHSDGKVSEETLNEVYGCPVDLIAHGIPHRVLGEHGHGEHCNHA